MQRTATHLTRGLGHSIAIRLQRPARRPIRASEEAVHDAAIEERDARAAVVSRGVVVAFRERHARGREHRRRESQAAGDRGEQRRYARGPQRSGHEHGDTERANTREDGEYDTPDERRWPDLAERRACRLEQLPVRYARWASGLAGAASETSIDVRVHARIVGAQLTFDERAHEDDTTARAVVLVLEVHVRWTRLQAEAAVDARLDSREGRGERRIGDRAGEGSAPGERRRRGHSTGSPRMPGLRSRCGSKADRTPRDNRSETAFGAMPGHSLGESRSKIRVSRDSPRSAARAASVGSPP